MKSESIRLPSPFLSVYCVWRRNLLVFRRLWMINIFWIVLEPLIVLLALGYGLGSFVSDIQGASYVDFFFPALLCISSMMVAFFECTYGNFSKLAHQKTYSTMILSPLEPSQIVVGEIVWGATKGTLSALGIVFIAGLFGHLDSLMFFPALLIIFMSSMMFAALGMVVTSYVKNYDQIIYPTSGLIVPMSLLSGTYFPLTNLPFGLEYFAYLMPLRHSVLAVRGCLLGNIPWWQILIHVLVILSIGLFLTNLSIKRIEKHLVQ